MKTSLYVQTEDDGIIKIHNGDVGTLVIAGKRIPVKIVSDGELTKDRIKYVITTPKKLLAF